MVNRCILSAISHPPILPIQTPILYSLRQMPDFDMFRIIQVRYRAGDFQDTVIGTGGEAETLHGGFEDGEERITARRQKRMHLYWGIRRQRTDKEGWKR